MKVNYVAGTLAVRKAIALSVGKGNDRDAVAYAAAQGRWGSDAGHVVNMIKTGIAAMDTASNTGMIDDAGLDLAAAARPMSIVGRLRGLRTVPFQASLINTQGGARGVWTGEGDGIPVGRFTLDSQVQLARLKFGTIVVLTDDLLRASSTNAEAAVRLELVAAAAEFEDQSFIDPLQAGSAGVQPASITYGAPTFASSGSSAAQISADLKILVRSLVDNGSNLGAAHWVMDSVTAVQLAGTGDAFPEITARGGTLHGLPVITSASLRRTGGSPATDGYIVLLDADGVWIADDGEAEVTASKKAVIQLDDAPTNSSTTPTPTSLVSLWQTNSTALRVTRYINWSARRDNVAAVLTGVNF